MHQNEDIEAPSARAANAEQMGEKKQLKEESGVEVEVEETVSRLPTTQKQLSKEGAGQIMGISMDVGKRQEEEVTGALVELREERGQ